jgi:hypothetical protein
LEVAPISKSKVLFEHLSQNTFFACMLQGKSHCIGELKTPNQAIGPKPLPKKMFKWIIV